MFGKKWEPVCPNCGAGLDREAMELRRDFLCPQCKCKLSVPEYYPRWYNWTCWFAAFGSAAATEICLGVKWPVESMIWPSLLFDFLCLCWFMLFRHSLIRLVWRFFPPDVVDPRKARYVSLG